MKKKLLTISVAAYNVENYMEETLDSICVPEIIEDLEIFVIDDGGTDASLEIAKKYQNKYPGSVIPVHKENGGWGSTVNYSVKHATGKYFKLLDGDDHYNVGGLTKLVEILKNQDADLVFTPYRRFDDKTGKTIEVFCVPSEYPHNEVVAVSATGENIQYVMAASTIRTSILQDNHVSVLEHCFYTDTEFITKAMAYINTVYITDDLVYEYRIGRAEQSVSLEGLRKHYKDNLRVVKELISFCDERRTHKSYQLIKNNTLSTIIYQYRAYIKLGDKKETMIFDKWLKQKHPDYYQIEDRIILNLRKSNFRSFSVYRAEVLVRSIYSGKIKMRLKHH